MKKRWLSVFLALCMIFSLLPFGAAAANEDEPEPVPEEEPTVVPPDESEIIIDHVIYRLHEEEGYAAVSGYEGNGTDVLLVIPSSVQGMPVTEIEENAFYWKDFRAVQIPTSVVQIGGGNFDKYLIRAVFYEGTPEQWENVSIGYDNDGLDDMNFDTENHILCTGQCGENLTWKLDWTGLLTVSGTGPMTNYENADASVFSDYEKITARTKKLVVEPGVTTIGEYAFSEFTHFEEAVLADTVTEICDHGFARCNNLQTVRLSRNLTRIGVSAFYDCYNLTDVEMYDSVKTIDDYAFEACRVLSEIRLSANLEYLGDWAFADCPELKELTIPAGVTKINGALHGCTGLEKITIQSPWMDMSSYDISDTKFYSDEKNWTNGVLYLGPVLVEAREDVASCTIRKGTTSIAHSAFENTKIQSIVIPESVTFIGTDVFSGCENLKSAVLPSTMSRIPPRMFSGCAALKTVKVPSGVTEIGYSAFSGCASLEELILPETVKTIDDRAFMYCSSLKEVALPDSVTMVGLFLFTGCSSLETLNIGSGLAEPFGFYNYAQEFSGCDSLQNFNVSPDNPIYSSVDGVLFSKDKTSIVKYPSGRSGSYIIPEGVKTIEHSAFNGPVDLNYVTVPESLVRISFYALLSSKQDKLYLPKFVEDLGINCISENIREIYYAGSEAQWQNVSISNYISHIIQKATIHYNHVHTWDNGTAVGTEKDLKACYTCTACGAQKIEAASLPLVSAQPNDASGKVGEKLTFTVAAMGQGLTYRWQYSEDGGRTWKNSSSTSTTATCTLNDVNRDGWLYRCIVKDASGKSVTSNTAKVIVLPAITTQPKSASGAIGEKVTFTIAATGKGLTYQWQYSEDGGKTWKTSSSTSTTATCTLASNRDGWLYRCIVKAANGKTVTSNTAKVTVVSGPTITTQPKAASGKVGDKLTFTVAAAGSGLTYQWQYSTDSGKTWKNSSSTSASATCTLSTAARDGWLYRCIVKDAGGKSVTSSTAKVTVLPAITTQPKAASGAVGEKVTFTIAATGKGLTYQWQYSEDGGKTWKTSSSTSTTATCTLTASRDGWLYRCIVKDANGKTVTSNTAKVTVVSGPVITTQPKAASGKVGDKLTFSIAATGSGLTYQWQYSTDSGKTWKNSSSTSTTATCTLSTAARDGWLYRCIVKDASGKTVTSSTAKVTVLPAITTQPKAASGKVGEKITFTIAATGKGLTYQWQYSEDGGKTWKTSSSTSTTATCTLTASRDGWLYRCIVKDANGRSVTSNTARVTVR